jgi:hypothetical protein
MRKSKKILFAIFALIIGLSVAMPMRALADDHGHDHDRHSHEWHGDRHAWRGDGDRDDHGRGWRWDWERDHYRAYPMAPSYAYGYRRGYVQPNGAGMVNPRHPNLRWACDSDGHHCHWAARRW